MCFDISVCTERDFFCTRIKSIETTEWPQAKCKQRFDAKLKVLITVVRPNTFKITLNDNMIRIYQS